MPFVDYHCFVKLDRIAVSVLFNPATCPVQLMPHRDDAEVKDAARSFIRNQIHQQPRVAQWAADEVTARLEECFAVDMPDLEKAYRALRIFLVRVGATTQEGQLTPVLARKLGLEVFHAPQ